MYRFEVEVFLWLERLKFIVMNRIRESAQLYTVIFIYRSDSSGELQNIHLDSVRNDITEVQFLLRIFVLWKRRSSSNLLILICSQV